MAEYRVVIETLHDWYEYIVEAPNADTAEEEAEALAMNDGLDPHRHHYIRTEWL